MRANFLAFGLVAILLGLFLLFAGLVHIGCSVGGSSTNPTFTNCNGAVELEEAGVGLCVLAVVLFAASLVPDRSARYK